MRKIYKVNNISCQSCVNLIKASLEEEFGNILIDLNTSPKELTIEFKENAEEENFKKELSELGFEVLED